MVVCPFESTSVSREAAFSSDSICPFHRIQHSPPDIATVLTPVKVNIVAGTHTKSRDSARLLADIGGGDKIREMTTRFYAYFIKDQHLKQFRFETDSAAAHGQRLGDWIVQKMGGEGDVWSESGRHNMRQVSHSKEWNYKKRSREVRGRHFNLTDCVVWMRVMFMAGREVGLDQHEVFWDWFVGFISHFIAVYERRAPPYTEGHRAAQGTNGCRQKSHWE